MSEMSNTKYHSKTSLLSQRILDNYQKKLEELYSCEVCYELDGIIVKINFYRAVIENTDSFREIMKIILNIKYKYYILDFTSAHFMDSTFLGALVMLLKQINSNGSKLSLILDFEKIKILTPFEQLKRILNVYASKEEAIFELKKQ